MAKRKDLFIFALKLAFSLVVLAGLLKIYRIRIQDIGSALKQADVFWILLSFSLHALGLLISARRWQILVRAQGDSVPLGFLAQSYLVGNFFNLFLPTRFGGDVVRIWDGSKYSRSLLRSSAVVLVERLTGILVLLMFAFAVSLYRIDMAQRFPVIWASLAIAFAGLLAIGLFFLPVTARLIRRLPDSGRLTKLKAKILEFRDVVLVYRVQKGPFFRALLWAFLLQVNVILHYYFVGKAFHLSIPFSDYFIFMPLVLLILTVPVTINGLGLREFLYIEIFRSYAHPSYLAGAFSAVADIAFTLIIGIIGGIVYVVRK